MNIIKERIDALRSRMKGQKLDAYYISGTDPHMSEYLPDRWKTREFITGFTGSYGEVVVTASEALLWTDTRYFIQAQAQLQGTGVCMKKLRVPEAISFDDWLLENLKPGSRVGVNPECLPYSTCKNLMQKLGMAGIETILCDDLLDVFWENRPSVPNEKIFELELQYTGQSRKDKFETILKKLSEADADCQILCTTDDLAWTFNLRGHDIRYTPVFIGFGIIGKNRIALFTDPEKIPPELAVKLKKEEIECYPYNHWRSFLQHLKGRKIYIDPGTTNTAVVQALGKNNALKEGPSIPAGLKAIKNETEAKGFRTAMRKDGVALVKFLFWLKKNIGKIKISEYDVAGRLASFRSEEEGFRGESFPSIVGYRDHGAMVHLSVDKGNAHLLKPEGLLLFDSGGHYWEGTTDITRTVALGPVSKKQKRDFTLALKGVIALTEAIFPEGTKGCHLDILARKALWENGLDYGHGTGHGVGHYLMVHEGPFSIRKEFNPYPIQPGMVLSNEPGIYREEEYGVRTENILLCVPKKETAFGKFYGFETLTVCPIDVSLIDPEVLTNKEKQWINSYHTWVRKILNPFLDEQRNDFLNEITPEVL
jgi:Xaa-Pro aminopeptidase